MDEVYILMCREATEIQGEWEPKLGDLSWDYFIFPKGQLRVLEEYEDSLNAKRHEDNFWLPRQEDLQEIYYKETQFPSFEGLLEDFNLFIESPDTIIQSHHNFNTIWLEFVMYQIYGKEWDGTTWEAI